MKRFIKNNQWGRRKTPLWKQFSVKTPGEPIVKTSLGVGVTRVRILKKIRNRRTSPKRLYR